MKTIYFLPFILVNILTFSIFSQSSSVNGKITDAGNGEAIYNAKVMVQGTIKGCMSDLNGEFHLTGLAAGTYTLEIRAVSYNNKVLTDVKLGATESKTIDVAMESVVKSLGPVTVTKTINKESTGSLLQLQRNSLVVLDGIPAELVKKSPDRTVGDALKRVSGASIQDNKFAVIRGLNDRYNAAYLNGAPLPSSEGDRKAFAFDIFPVNMLDNLTIVKTASPDLPAEFAGGIIQVKTKDIPVENFQSLSIGAGYNALATFKTALHGETGKLDWLGISDKTRNMPSSIPSVTSYPSLLSDQANLAKTFSYNWKLSDYTFMPNLNLQYAAGIRKAISEEREFGFIGSLSYNRTNSYQETIRRSYTDNAAGGTGASQMETDYLDKAYINQTLVGAMANFAFKLNNANSFSFKNLYSINSDNRLINRSGEVNPEENNPTLLRSNANWFTSNQIYSGQLNGNHALLEGKLKLDWTTALSSIQRTIPNLRRSIYTRLKNVNDPNDPNPYDTMWVANISQSNVGPDYGGSMFFSTNKEKIYCVKVNGTYSMKWGNIKTDLKAGAFTQFRNRDFTARQLGYTKYGVSGGNVNFDYNLLYQPEDSIFSPEHMGLMSNGLGGFKLSDGTKASDSYQASSNLYAGYVSLYNAFKNLKLIYGVRIEDFTQKLNALRADKTTLNVVQHNLDFLPSVNAIYTINDKHNIRLSGSQTLNRPEYRELAPFAFYDFSTQFVLSGNDSLKRAKITNADLRYEYYPGNGQLLSATIFYKYFSNPIEQIARPDVMNEITYKNVPSASNFGIELEAKTTLGSLFFADTASWLRQFQVFTNLGLIRSKVDVSQNIGTPYASRPLQGQSPYVFNFGMTYQTKSDLSFTANINKVGPRIYVLGSVLQPDIWEKSRTFLDLQVAKQFLNKKLELKINCQNVLAQKLIFYQNNYGSTDSRGGFTKFTDFLFLGDKTGENRYNERTDDLVWSTRFAPTFSFSLTYKF